MKSDEQVLTETVANEYRFDGMSKTKIWEELGIWTGDVNVKVWTKVELEKLHYAIQNNHADEPVKLLLTASRADRRILERTRRREMLHPGFVLERGDNQLWLRAKYAINWDEADKFDLLGVNIPFREAVRCETLTEMINEFSKDGRVRHTYYRPAIVYHPPLE